MSWLQFLRECLGIGPVELDRIQPGHTRWAAIFWIVVLALAIIWLAGAIAQRRAV
jgi:hypothetical protein